MLSRKADLLPRRSRRSPLPRARAICHAGMLLSQGKDALPALDHVPGAVLGFGQLLCLWKPASEGTRGSFARGQKAEPIS